MKVLIFCDTFYPEKNSAAKLLNDLSIFISKKNKHNVDIFTINGDYSSKSKDLFKIFSLNIKNIKSKTLFIRGLLELYSGFYFIFLHLRYRCSTPYKKIIYYNPSILQFFFLIYLKLFYQKSNFILILRDIFPDWAIELGIIKNIFIKKFLYFSKFINIHFSDLVFCESKSKLNFIKKQFPKKNIKLLYNWTNFNVEDIKKNINRSKTKKFIYAGNIGNAQDVSSCVNFIVGLSNKGHTVDFFSEGRKFHELSLILKDYKNINFFDTISPDELDLIISNYDGGLIFLSESLTLDNIPGKVLLYLANGIPTFGAINFNNELIDIINQNALGLLTGSRRLINSEKFINKVIENCNNLDPKNINFVGSQLFSVGSAFDKIFS